MALTIIGAVIFVVSIGVMIIASKVLPKTARLVVLVVMVELLCVSGLLIALGLYDMGLMD